MEPTPSPAPTPVPDPVPIPPAPAPVPAPLPIAPPPAPPPPPKEGIFDGMTLVDWGILVLASAGLISAIYYFGSKISNMKDEKGQVQQDINELKSNVQSIMGGKYKTA